MSNASLVIFYRLVIQKKDDKKYTERNILIRIMISQKATKH